MSKRSGKNNSFPFIQGKCGLRTFSENWTSTLDPNLTANQLLSLARVHEEEQVVVDVLQLQLYNLGRTVKKYMLPSYRESLLVCFFLPH